MRRLTRCPSSFYGSVPSPNSKVPTWTRFPSLPSTPGGYIQPTSRQGLQPGGFPAGIQTCRIFQCGRKKAGASVRLLPQSRGICSFQQIIHRLSLSSWRTFLVTAISLRHLKKEWTSTGARRPSSSAYPKTRLRPKTAAWPRPSTSASSMG